MSFPFKNLVINSHHKLRQHSWLQVKPIFLQMDDVAAGPVSSTNHASVSISATSFIVAIVSPVKRKLKWDSLEEQEYFCKVLYPRIWGTNLSPPFPLQWAMMLYSSSKKL